MLSNLVILYGTIISNTKKSMNSHGLYDVSFLLRTQEHDCNNHEEVHNVVLKNIDQTYLSSVLNKLFKGSVVHVKGRIRYIQILERHSMKLRPSFLIESTEIN